MANSLLDFVMSLVRDPEVAAAYAADPAQAIADANLVGVTSVDVSNLIPVVRESLSLSTPGFGVDSVSDDPAGNVWASGAATAAFDAFGDHVPASAFDDASTLIAHTVDRPEHAGIDPLDVGAPPESVVEHVSALFGESAVDDLITDVPVPTEDWAAGVVEHIHPDNPDFDIFD